jgi:PAS domain S-box-containing protein
MFPSKIVIASSDLSLNQTLKNLLQKSGWGDIRIFESIDGILEYCCLTNEEILIFFYANLAPPLNLLELLQLLRRNFQALLILILDPHQVDYQLQAKLGKVIDGFILQPISEHSLIATLYMARERRQRELDLLKSEEKFQRLFHKSSDPSFLLHNHIFIDCNQAALDSLRAERTEIIGKSPAELSPETQPDGSLSNEKAEFYIKEALKNGFVQFHWLHRRLDGSEFLAEVSLTTIPYAGDLALYAKWRDITEIEQYKKSLLISEQRYRQLFETMLNGFALHEIILDEHNQPVDYRFIVVNPAFEKLTGLRAENIVGKTVLEVMPNTEPYWIETYGRVACTGDPVLIENYSQELDRYYRVFAFSPTQGQFATLFEDITLQKKNERYQAALLQLSEKIRQTYSTEEMSQTVVHAIRSILEIETAAIALKTPENDTLYRIVYGIGKAKQWIGAEFSKDQGITGYAIRSQTPYFQNNLTEDPYYLRDQPHYYDPYVAAVPLLSGKEPVGALMLGRNKPFTDSDQMIITAMGELIGNALQRMLLQEKTQQTVDYLSALRKIDLTITHGRDLGERLRVLLEAVIEHQKVDAASIWLKDPQTDFYKLSAAQGFHLKELPNLIEPYPGIRTDVTQIVHLQYEHLNNALEGDFSSLVRNEGFVNFMGIPLITKKNHWGILQLWKCSEIKPTHEWMNFLEMLAGQAAIAIEDIQLLTDLQYHINELQIAYDTTLQGWAKALEIRDAETQNHSQRVTQITIELAKRLGIAENQLPHIRRGTLLHDIGKMGIPDAILNKPGPLSPEEWQIMRRHPQMAYDILSGIPFLKPALDIPYYHHEKWDGSGYPNGLKGEEIPLAARIFAVVDVWDALLSDRPYRPAWKKHEVIAYLREQSGKQFDPKVVDAFLQLISELESQTD